MIRYIKIKLDEGGYRSLSRGGLSIFVLFLFLFLSFFVGGRSIQIGDTDRYLNVFNKVFQQDFRISEPFFIYLVGFVKMISGSFTLLLTIISFFSVFMLMQFYNKLALLCWRKYGNKYWIYIYMAVIVTFLSPFFWNGQVNVIRSGLAIPLVLLSIYHLYVKKYFLYFAFAFIAIMFHYSSLIFVLSAFSILFFSKRCLIIVFILLVVLYFVGFWESFVNFFIASLNVDFLNNYDHYTSKQGDYRSGIRFDFLFFTLSFAFLIYIYDSGKSATLLSDFLLKAYIVLTYPFLIIGFISYSDRLLLPVWFLIPPILVYVFVVRTIPNYFYYLLPFSFFILTFMLIKKGLLLAF